MKIWALRFFRVLLVAVLAWVLFRWLEPQGYGWAMLVAAGGLTLSWIGWRAGRIRRARARDAETDRWAQALMSPPHRPAAIADLRAIVAGIDREKRAREHAQRSLVLAELLEADGEPGAAVREAALTEPLAAVVRHARAVASLSMGEPEAALDALDALPGPCGDASIDLRVRLLRGLIAVERGDPQEALEIARIARDETRGDAELTTEARVLEAVALDALGDPPGALKVLGPLEDDMLQVLSMLGLPRVRRLAAAVLEERAADED